MTIHQNQDIESPEEPPGSSLGSFSSISETTNRNSNLNASCVMPDPSMLINMTRELLAQSGSFYTLANIIDGIASLSLKRDENELNYLEFGFSKEAFWASFTGTLFLMSCYTYAQIIRQSHRYEQFTGRGSMRSFQIENTALTNTQKIILSLAALATYTGYIGVPIEMSSTSIEDPNLRGVAYALSAILCAILIIPEVVASFQTFEERNKYSSRSTLTLGTLEETPSPDISWQSKVWQSIRKPLLLFSAGAQLPISMLDGMAVFRVFFNAHSALSQNLIAAGLSVLPATAHVAGQYVSNANQSCQRELPQNENTSRSWDAYNTLKSSDKIIISFRALCLGIEALSPIAMSPINLSSWQSKLGWAIGMLTLALCARAVSRNDGMEFKIFLERCNKSSLMARASGFFCNTKQNTETIEHHSNTISPIAENALTHNKV